MRRVARDAGIERIHVVAWRDLDDVEAGGSEVHAAHVCRQWAEAGLDVVMRTSFAQGHPPEVERDGYRVVRRAGRYLVFPRAAVAELARAHGRRDALVEIWNGMPFFSPIWARGPRLTLLHHVHGDMWRMVLPDRLADLGDTIERRLAPWIYRRSQIATLSSSSKADIVEQLRLRADRVSVIPPGIDDRFRPGGSRSHSPRVVAVGRLVPVKRFDRLIEVAAKVRAEVPDLELRIIGEGYERLALESKIDHVGGADWIRLVGRVSDDDLVEEYRSAWLVASLSSHEGWGMSLTEAAACGTPAVATDIAGHRDAVLPGRTRVLASDDSALAAALTSLLTDHTRRAELAAAGVERSRDLRWPNTALQLLEVLASTSRTR